MVHVPDATMCTVVPFVPLVVQTPAVCDVNETVRPEEAVALTAKSASVTSLSERAPKVIVCAISGALLTVND